MSQFGPPFSEPSDSEADRNRRGLETSAARSPSAARAPSTREFEALLNEIAQQALLTTRATGAAIALAQDGEMVCRASTGGHAPDLGVQLDTASGLSGACVQTQRVQICNDTESDPRVDVDACQALGVRSILVAPLLREKTLVGVVELFSPVVRSFGERDIQTLEACARRILDAMDKGKAADEMVKTEEPKMVAPIKVDPPPSLLAEGPAHVEPPRRHDFVTTVLTGLVIGLAILLGSLLGMRMSRQRAGKTMDRGVASSPVRGRSGTAAQATDGAAKVVGADAAQLASGRIVSPVNKKETSQDQSGGLIVYQNDRVVFQLPPSKGKSAENSESAQVAVNSAGLEQLSPEAAGQLLASRVEPQYPAEALAAHIQGAVGVRLTVDRTGAVQRARVYSGPPELAQAAVDAVKQWRFRPYSPNGTAESFQTTATIDFRLP